MILLTPSQVKKALKTLGWTNIEAALKMGLTVDSIENYLSGKSRCKGPASLLLIKFCNDKERRGEDGKNN